MAVTLLDHGTANTNLNVTATTPATAQTYMTTNTIAVDGSTTIAVWFFILGFQSEAISARDLNIAGNLFDNGVDLGRILQLDSNATIYILGGGLYGQVLTPAAGNHIYTLRFWDPGALGAADLVVGQDPDVGNVFCWWAVFSN